MRIFVNILLILLFPVLVLFAEQTFSNLIGDAGNWAVVIVMSLFALVVWIWDEKKQNKH
ncbi:MAG: hypothetical protein LBT37_06915 [Lactobacillaceae bacterium]|jgi:membrane protease YdiL (CAAX protease family)|nr:hypothetical protein [Lactobacillaceae bacterium]